MRISDWSSDVCSSDLVGNLSFAERLDQAADGVLDRMVGNEAEHVANLVGIDVVGADIVRRLDLDRNLAALGKDLRDHSLHGTGDVYDRHVLDRKSVV